MSGIINKKFDSSKLNALENKNREEINKSAVSNANDEQIKESSRLLNKRLNQQQAKRKAENQNETQKDLVKLIEKLKENHEKFMSIRQESTQNLGSGSRPHLPEKSLSTISESVQNFNETLNAESESATLPDHILDDSSKFLNMALEFATQLNKKELNLNDNFKNIKLKPDQELQGEQNKKEALNNLKNQNLDPKKLEETQKSPLAQAAADLDDNMKTLSNIMNQCNLILKELPKIYEKSEKEFSADESEEGSSSSLSVMSDEKELDAGDSATVTNLVYSSSLQESAKKSAEKKSDNPYSQIVASSSRRGMGLQSNEDEKSQDAKDIPLTVAAMQEKNLEQSHDIDSLQTSLGWQKEKRLTFINMQAILLSIVTTQQSLVNYAVQLQNGMVEMLQKQQANLQQLSSMLVQLKSVFTAAQNTALALNSNASKNFGWDSTADYKRPGGSNSILSNGGFPYGFPGIESGGLSAYELLSLATLLPPSSDSNVSYSHFANGDPVGGGTTEGAVPANNVTLASGQQPPPVYVFTETAPFKTHNYDKNYDNAEAYYDGQIFKGKRALANNPELFAGTAPTGNNAYDRNNFLIQKVNAEAINNGSALTTDASGNKVYKGTGNDIAYCLSGGKFGIPSELAKAYGFQMQTSAGADIAGGGYFFTKDGLDKCIKAVTAGVSGMNNGVDVSNLFPEPTSSSTQLDGMISSLNTITSSIQSQLTASSSKLTASNSALTTQISIFTQFLSAQGNFFSRLFS